MKVNLKFITFCLIAIILILSYRKAMHATKTVIAKIYGVPATLKSFSNSRGIVPPSTTRIYSIAYLYSLIQASSKSADFIVTDLTGRSLGGANRVLGQNWPTKMANANAVILKRGDFIDPKSIPSNETLSRLGNPPLSAPIKKFIQWIMANYKKVTLYFNYPNDTNPTHRLYITDPNPGDVKIIGNQIVVPAYINVLSKWNLN